MDKEEFRAAGQIDPNSFDDEKRQFTARVVNYGVVDSYGSVWAPGVFTRGLEKKLPKAVWGHDWLDPIGRAIEYTDRPTGANPGLDVRVQLDDFEAVPRARQAYAQLKSGSMDEYSFGFRRGEWSEKREDLEPYQGQEHRAVELMTEARMDEISIVLKGAVPGTKTLSVRADVLTDIRPGVVGILEAVQRGDMRPEDAVRALSTTAGDDDAVDAPDGAMVALLPDADTAAYLTGLKGRGTKAGDLHLTLAYLGKAVDVDDAERTSIIGAITSWAAQNGPVSVEVAGTAYLGPDAARVVLVESAGLVGCFMDVAEMAPAGEHESVFIPHITIGTSGPLPLPEDDHVLVFDRIVVAFATARTVIELVGQPGELQADDLDEMISDAMGVLDYGW